MPRKKPHTTTADVHIRLDPEDWRELQLYCNSGIVTVSATAIVSLLLSVFIDTTVKHHDEFDLEATIEGIKNAVRTGTPKVEQQRSGR